MKSNFILSFTASILVISLLGCSSINKGSNQQYRTPSSESEKQYSNYEQQEFIAGSAHFSSGAYYKSGQAVPLDHTQAKNLVSAKLQDICQRHTQLSGDLANLNFEYSDKSDTAGADFGDIVLHPIKALTEKAIRFGGNLRCDADPTVDPLVQALKTNDPTLFKYSNLDGMGSWINFFIVKEKHNVGTAMIRFFRKDGQKNIEVNPNSSNIKFQLAWLRSKKEQTADLNSRITEVTPSGVIFSKIDLTTIQKYHSSWSTSYRFQVLLDGVATESFTLFDYTTGAMKVDVYLK